MKKYPLLPLRYIVAALRPDQWVLPGALWALFVLIVWMVRGGPSDTQVVTAYLGFVLPLVSGILAANAILDDRALELLLAAPRPAWLTLTERLGVTVVSQALLALAYQGAMAFLGMDLAFLGNLAVRQLAWLIPTLGLIAVATAFSFLLAQSIAGALLVGAIWIVQTILHGWFLVTPWRRYLFLFLGAYRPGHPDLPTNQALLAGLTLALLLLAWALFRRQERYL